jgi:acyl-coenzyme A synthetase/AMP-(fatty) acid ligase
MRDLPPNMTDYLATRSTFRLEVPEVYNYARDVVDAWAAKEPAKLALLAVGPDGGDARRFSSADLAASSNRAARFLASLGLGKGDPVFVMLPRIPEWYDVVLGCIKLGAVPMPGTTLLTARDIDYRLERAGARVAVTDPEGADKVDQAAKRMGVDLTRILVRSQEAGGPSSGWASWEDGLESASDQPPAVEPTRSDDPILVYFTSGTVAYATVGYPMDLWRFSNRLVPTTGWAPGAVCNSAQCFAAFAYRRRSVKVLM